MVISNIGDCYKLQLNSNNMLTKSLMFHFSDVIWNNNYLTGDTQHESYHYQCVGIMKEVSNMSTQIYTCKLSIQSLFSFSEHNIHTLVLNNHPTPHSFSPTIFLCKNFCYHFIKKGQCMYFIFL